MPRKAHIREGRRDPPRMCAQQVAFDFEDALDLANGLARMELDTDALGPRVEALEAGARQPWNHPHIQPPGVIEGEDLLTRLGSLANLEWRVAVIQGVLAKVEAKRQGFEEPVVELRSSHAQACENSAGSTVQGEDGVEKSRGPQRPVGINLNAGADQSMAQEVQKRFDDQERYDGKKVPSAWKTTATKRTRLCRRGSACWRRASWQSRVSWNGYSEASESARTPEALCRREVRREERGCFVHRQRE